MSESPDRSDNIFSLYRPDLLPLSATEDDGGIVDVRSTHARMGHLQRVPLFADCTEDELRRIADISRIVERPAETILTETGQPGDSFFLLIDGRVSVQTVVGDRGPLGPGDFFGEMSLLDGQPRSSTIRALTDVRLLMVDRSHFWQLLNQTPDLVRRMLVTLSGRVRHLEQTLNAVVQQMNQT